MHKIIHTIYRTITVVVMMMLAAPKELVWPVTQINKHIYIPTYYYYDL